MKMASLKFGRPASSAYNAGQGQAARASRHGRFADLAHIAFGCVVEGRGEQCSGLRTSTRASKQDAKLQKHCARRSSCTYLKDCHGMSEF